MWCSPGPKPRKRGGAVASIAVAAALSPDFYGYLTRSGSNPPDIWYDAILAHFDKCFPGQSLVGRRLIAVHGPESSFTSSNHTFISTSMHQRREAAPQWFIILIGSWKSNVLACLQRNVARSTLQLHWAWRPQRDADWPCAGSSGCLQAQKGYTVLSTDPLPEQRRNWPLHRNPLSLQSPVTQASGHMHNQNPQPCLFTSRQCHVLRKGNCEAFTQFCLLYGPWLLQV